MPKTSLICGILVIIQLNCVLTRSLAINCYICHVFNIFVNQSRLNSVLIQQDDTLRVMNSSVFRFQNANFTSELSLFSNTKESNDTSTKIDPLSSQQTNDISNEVHANTTSEGSSTMSTSSNSVKIVNEVVLSIQSNFTTTNNYINETVELNTSSFTDITFVTTAYINTTFNSSDISIPQPENHLALILSLTLGLGLPLSVGSVAGLVYYCKIYRPTQTRIDIIYD